MIDDRTMASFSDNIRKEKILDFLMYMLNLMLVLYIVWSSGALIGFPRGDDAYAHLTRIKYIVKFFPYHNWNYQWDFGVPLFQGSYPPMAYYLLAGIIVLTGFSPEAILTFFTLFSVILNSLGLLAFLYKITDHRISSLISITLLNLSPVYWSNWLMIGLYSRVISIGFVGFSLYLASRICTGKNNKPILFSILALVLSTSLSSHLIGGFISISMVSFYILMHSNTYLDNIKKIITLILLVFALNGFYITQLFFSNLTARGFLGAVEYYPAPLEFLIYPSSGFSFHSFIIPTLIIILFFYLIIHHKIKTPLHSKHYFIRARGGLYASGFISILFCLYAIIGYLPFYPKHLYIDGLSTSNALSVAIIGCCMMIGILISLILIKLDVGIMSNNRIKISKRRLTFITSTFLVLCLLYGLVFELPIIHSNSNDSEFFPAMNVIQLDPDILNQRLGTDTTAVALWFNYLYDIPQNRDYYAQGVPHPEWNFLQAFSIWGLSDNYDETNFILDWYALRWILTDHDQGKFLNRPEYYRLINHEGNWYEFEYYNATGILTASNTPVAMFIGSEEAYSILFRSLSLSNFNSKSLILLYGGEYIDESSELISEDIDLLILYGYNYRYQEDAYLILREYVKKGGCLLLFTDLSRDASTQFLPDPSPIWSTSGLAFGKDWNFTYTPNEYMTEVNFSRFSPAIYADGSWGYSGSTNLDLKESSEVILWNYGEPVIVQMLYGEGKVIWCGLNFPLHIVSYRNNEESLLLVKLIQECISVGIESDSTYIASQVNPEHFEVEVSSSTKGVLFKESYFSHWRAYLETQKGIKLHIFKAGPNFMYVFLPNDVWPAKIIFRFEKSGVQQAGNLLSLCTFCILVFNATPFRNIITRLVNSKKNVNKLV